MCLALSCPSNNRKILPVEILMEQQQGILPPLLLCTCSDGRHIHGNPWESEETWLQIASPGGELLIVMEPMSTCQCFAPSQTAFRLSGGSVLGEFCPFCPTYQSTICRQASCALPPWWNELGSTCLVLRQVTGEKIIEFAKSVSAYHLKRFPKWSVGICWIFIRIFLKFESSCSSHGFSEAFAWAWNHWLPGRPQSRPSWIGDSYWSTM